jgi:hypothetical protein
LNTTFCTECGKNIHARRHHPARHDSRLRLASMAGGQNRPTCNRLSGLKRMQSSYTV